MDIRINLCFTPGMTQTIIPTLKLHHRLTLAMEVARVTDEQMAKHLGCSKFTAANYRRGNTKPNPSAVRDWARLTGVNECWLITGTTDTDGYMDAAIARYTGGLLYNQDSLFAEAA